MNNTIEIRDSNKKDHKHLLINGVDMGHWEISQRRHLIEVLDNSINASVILSNDTRRTK